MPLEDTAPSAAAPAEVSFDDALALMGEDQPQDDQPKAKAPEAVKQAAEDEDQELLSDPDDLEEEETPEDETATSAETLTDDAIIDLGEGKTAKLADLKQTYETFEKSMVEQTRVMQEVATERGNLHNLGSNMAQALENVSNYLVDRLPPEPDPDLAYNDPGEHYRQTMMRNSAIAELQNMLAVVDGSREAVAMLSEADFNALKADEDRKWITTMPTLKDPRRFALADTKAKNYAKSIGFSEDEVNTTADHRLRKVFFEAARYGEIMANASKARGKVENASVMAPAKARSLHTNSRQALEQVNARKALAKSGRLDDALKLNW